MPERDAVYRVILQHLVWTDGHEANAETEAIADRMTHIALGIAWAKREGLDV